LPWRTAGCQGALGPLVPFLAPSWGMPRRCINLPPRVVRRTKERKLNSKQLLLLTRTLLRACAVQAWMPFLCRSTKKWRKKRNPGVPPGNPLALPSAKRNKRDHISAFSAVLQILPTRAAGEEGKNFCQDKLILGVRSCAQDGGGLQRQKSRRLSKSRRVVGSQGALGPLVPFLAPSWGTPRRCINLPPRVVRRTKERKLNAKQHPIHIFFHKHPTR